MDSEEIVKKIKTSFCNLTSFKVRDNILEVITAYSTINNKFISAFITSANGKIVVTDNGWIDQNYYDTPLFDESEDIISRVTTSFKASYNIKSTLDKSGVQFFYKTCNSLNEISSAVFDLANFTAGVINAFCIQYKDEKEEMERETFRTDANNFLKANYADQVRLRNSLEDYQNIKFSAIINKRSRLYLITYVTGSTARYFENDLRKSIVNFELASKSKYKDIINEKITILNDKSFGFQPERSANIIELLVEKTTREPIKWTEREKLLEIV